MRKIWRTKVQIKIQLAGNKNHAIATNKGNSKENIPLLLNGEGKLIMNFCKEGWTV